eukprot:scaffold9317_cov76-Phaeocystis_antarctica.AAC.4
MYWSIFNCLVGPSTRAGTGRGRIGRGCCGRGCGCCGAGALRAAGLSAAAGGGWTAGASTCRIRSSSSKKAWEMRYVLSVSCRITRSHFSPYARSLVIHYFEFWVEFWVEFLQDCRRNRQNLFLHGLNIPYVTVFVEEEWAMSVERFTDRLAQVFSRSRQTERGGTLRSSS